MNWLDFMRIRIRTPFIFERLIVSYGRRQLLNSDRPVDLSVGRRRLLLDVSVISRHDAGTGIQRFVRAVFNELQTNVGEQFVLCPVAATRKKKYSHVVWNGVGISDDAGREVSITPSDIFLGLDFSTHAVSQYRHQLADWKRIGAKLYFIVHDLLPEQHPEWFSTAAVLSYRAWIKSVALLADGIFCNSLDTERNFIGYCKKRYGIGEDDLTTSVLPMGWNIASAIPTMGLPHDFADLLDCIGRCASVLMVGTLEPRKGHAQVLAAFNRLWSQGKDCNLVIVGHPGWKTESLQNEIRNHPELNRRLFWLDDASDEALQGLYVTCDGVLIASLAEGYGLPMIEAMGHGKHILARDLPVFREQAQIAGAPPPFLPLSMLAGLSSAVEYFIPCADKVPIEFFVTQSDIELAVIIRAWLDRIHCCAETTRNNVVFPTWRDTAVTLLNGLGSELDHIDNCCIQGGMNHA